MTHIHLVLKKQWFDKIKSGEKTVEYREIKPYWIKKFKKKYNEVIFHCGYTNKIMIFEIKKIEITTQENDLNLKKCFAVYLGGRIG